LAGAMADYDEDEVLDFMFEMGQLKRLPRTGWFRAGVDEPETVAAHNLRAAQLAYVLACMEEHPDPERICTMIVFHEIGEARVTDLDHVAKLYTTRAEDKAAAAQLAEMGPLGEDVYDLWDECEHGTTEAGTIAKDADKLEAAITAREYVENGHLAAEAWIEDTREMLATDSAKRLIDALEDKSFNDWWQDLDFSEIHST
jgi:putative hydrolase of HD superfamily